MCGIYGEFLFKKPLDPALSFKKLNLMTHRGPDGFGFEWGDFIKGVSQVSHNVDLEGVEQGTSPINYFLGHRRLSINDLSVLASQPMESLDKRYSITFNGEIYNFVELRKELEEKGCRFKTDHSDTEVLLNAYGLWGEECLEKLNGMFAFAIFDRRLKTLFLARDRIGEKPLYYEINGEKFIFSSELTPIISFNADLHEIDSSGLAQYLVFGYVPHPFTIFKGVNKLPPASFMKLDLKTGDFSIKNYWDISLIGNLEKSREKFTSDTEGALSDSVNMRLRADVSISAFLSGGIDSTLVIKKIKELRGEGTDVFGADFPNTPWSEKEYIEEAGMKYGHSLNVIPIDIEKSDNIKNLISVFDEPFDGGSSIAVFELLKEVSRKYKVILTGDGGDELFAGYPRYREFARKFKLAKLLNRLPFAKSCLRLLKLIGVSPGKLNRLLDFMSLDPISNYLEMRYNYRLTNLLKKKIDLGGLVTIKNVISKVHDGDVSPIKALQYLEFKTILPGRMLYKIDRFSMYYGVEARTPFLDHRLAELAFTIPETYNVSNENTKMILKDILKSDFPDKFINRSKQGFGNPLNSWFRSSELKGIFRNLNNEDSVIFNYIDYEKLHKEFPEFKQGYDGKRQDELWRLVVLEQFLENSREFIKFN